MLVSRQAGINGVAWWPWVGAIVTLGTDAKIAVLGDQICSLRVGNLASAHGPGKDQVQGLSVFKAIGGCLCGYDIGYCFSNSVLVCHLNLGI